MIFDSSPPVEVVRELFEEYSRHIGVALCVQNFAAELEGLPDNYDVILVAREGASLAGCVGLRPFHREAGTAELKRLYVREGFRGMGLGRKLAEAAIGEARVRGYERLKLDTLATMGAAIAMYRTMGFQEFLPGHQTDFPGQLFFRVDIPR